MAAQLMTLKRAAEVLGCHYNTTIKLAARGVLHPVEVDGLDRTGKAGVQATIVRTREVEALRERYPDGLPYIRDIIAGKPAKSH